MAFGGGRTLLMQATHPVAFAGFFAHTGALDEPYERLTRTARGHGHDRVRRAGRGRAADAARARHAPARARGAGRAGGRFPAGTPYAADDPELLLWILAAWPTRRWWPTSATSAASPATSATPTGRTTRSSARLFALRDADMPAEIEDFDAVHGRDGRGRRAARERRCPRARRPDRHAPAGAAAGSARCSSWRTS